MNEVWNLEKIYKGFDDPAFEADLATLKEEIAAYNDLAQKIGTMDPLEGLRVSTKMEEQLTSRLMKLAEYASLRQSADSRDADAGSQLGRIMAAYSGVAAPNAAITDWVAKLPNLMELVESDEELAGAAHCSKLLVKKGDRVYQGQHIAEMGKTGRVTGTHLHFEIRYNGKTQNPLKYVKK